MYDYVIVGAGSAGCVLANRLSEDPDTSVCLVEAGPPDSEEGLHIPVAFSQLYKTPFDWDFATEPEPALDGRNVYLPRGRVLGGSSSLNAMIYIRGNRRDYDEWRDLGNAGWGWDDVLPYFKRAEDNERGASEFHGAGGPLSVSDSHSMHPMADAFVEAAAATGLDRLDDFNTGEQDGVGRYQMTQRDGMRCSTAVAYLHPALPRPEPHADPDGARDARAVRRQPRERRRGRGRRGADRAAGRSRGDPVRGRVPVAAAADAVRHRPADDLTALGIDVRLDQPAVGGNLQDHLNAGIILFTTTRRRSRPPRRRRTSRSCRRRAAAR
jgi:choline dehydrogenase